MPIENINQQANPNVTAVTNGPRALARRPLAVATTAVFFVSSAFPVVAGLSKNTASCPKWWGTLDVGLAFALAILAFAAMVATKREVDRQCRRHLPRLADS
jgi:hypothetical protein